MRNGDMYVLAENIRKLRDSRKRYQNKKVQSLLIGTLHFKEKKGAEEFFDEFC